MAALRDSLPSFHSGWRRAASQSTLLLHPSLETDEDEQTALSMPSFLQEIDRLRQQTETLRASQLSLSSLQYRHLQSKHSSEDEVEQLQDEIQDLHASHQKITASIRQSILVLNTSNKLQVGGKDGGFDVRRQHLENATRKFRDVLKESYRLEKVSRDTYTANAERQYRIVKSDATPAELSAALSGHGSQIFGKALLQTRDSGARTAFNEAQKRNGELHRIEQSLNELSALMQDMADLVFAQDEVIINIEKGATDVEAETKQGLVELTKAKYLAMSTRRKRMLCTGVLGSIVLLIVIIAIASAVHGSSKSGNESGTAS